ncbi:lysozyme inhibitor LprI family protein [Thalassotalea castellviae]|uniref:Lysozyme inhibitor LprI family protein n=1 Tax=Thalassotalea castellviae TaxID=3075612 RepID=A0ABU2ZW44_9GAMM|nr:lysozyme inhibitor LprI family protein [Thalassotalea sp. W431]MDT0602157.1 lysozyme inhibitor LprI family protein [Thalassotalea sp. W431]
MNKLIYKLLCIGLLCVSSHSNAYQAKKLTDCDKQFSNNTELSRCLDIVKDSIDRELQTWINSQVFILEEFALETGRRSALEMFKRSQRNFITYRENNCRWQYLHISPDTRAAAAFKKCYITTTRNRINELSQLEKNN